MEPSHTCAYTNTYVHVHTCIYTDENSVDLSWVDLTLNPERYTGYSGHSTERIWKAIYHENCFRSECVSVLTAVGTYVCTCVHFEFAYCIHL